MEREWTEKNVNLFSVIIKLMAVLVLPLLNCCLCDIGKNKQIILNHANSIISAFLEIQDSQGLRNEVKMYYRRDLVLKNLLSCI